MDSYVRDLLFGSNRDHLHVFGDMVGLGKQAE
jgi:hypothetical protein